MKAIFLIGLPGVGKSYFIKHKLKSEFNMDNYVVLSTDDYIQRYADQSNKTYNDVFREVYPEAEREMFKTLQLAIMQGIDIVWDQTNLTIGSRKKKLSLIPDNYEKIAVVMNTPDEEVHKERLKRPGKTMSQNVIDSMKNSYQAPSLGEGFDQIVINT